MDTPMSTPTLVEHRLDHCRSCSDAFLHLADLALVKCSSLLAIGIVCVAVIHQALRLKVSKEFAEVQVIGATAACVRCVRRLLYQLCMSVGTV